MSDDSKTSLLDIANNGAALNQAMSELASSIEDLANIKLPVANGGTGASTAVDARTNLGIGSIGPLNTPLTVPDGGTGLQTTTAYAVLCGGTTTTNKLQSIGSVGTTGQVLQSNGATSLPSFTSDLTNITSLNSGQFAGMRNTIINGAMGIDQRNNGAAQTFTAASALSYSVDRWYGYCTGANVTGQRIAGSGNTQFRYRFTGAASVTGIGFAQRIEAANSYYLAGNKATLSVDLANSFLTNVTWRVFYANSTNSFGTLASPTRTQIATGTFVVTNTVTRFLATMDIPAAATTGLEIVFSVGSQTSGTWTIGNAQLELGSSATPFEQRLIGTELSLCQRYYYKTDGDIRVQGYAAGTQTNAYNTTVHPTTMRATPVPTTTFSSTVQSASQIVTATPQALSINIQSNAFTGYFASSYANGNAINAEL